MKKLIAFIMSLIMTFVLAVPAFATPRSGSGYAVGSFIHNSALYDVTVSLAADSSHAVYTTCNTAARVTRIHNKITVAFRTVHDGYLTKSGGETTVFQPGLSSSERVIYPCNASEFVSYGSMNGSVTVKGDTSLTLTVSA